MLIPLGLIVIITTVDVLTPKGIHLGPLLVVAPALTASFAGPRCTAAIGALAFAAGVLDGFAEGNLTTPEHQVELLALLAVSALVVLFCAIRERRLAVLGQVRSVSEVAQRVLLRPLPRQVGPLCIASMYLAAAAEAKIGGDLYAAVRLSGGTRLLIGDVRGKGLTSISEVAAVLCAFREAPHRDTALSDLALHLEASVSRDAVEYTETNADALECFVTASLIEVPDREPTVRLVSCGHPPPLILRGGRVLILQPNQVAPPLGLGLVSASELVPTTFSFQPGDILLLYTDGVVEARDRTRAFYDLPERLRQWAGEDVDTLIQRLREDLFAHAGGRLDDDTAVIAIERLPAPARPPAPPPPGHPRQLQHPPHMRPHP
ncbi:MAG: PP2C family protein-serine/threonine phosphatase [Actinoallomurus sp.]